MDDFPGNSHTSRIEPRARDRRENRDSRDQQEPKKIEKVISGTVRRRKKSLGAKFMETFGGEDSSSVMDYILFEVLIPAAKDVMYDVFTQGLERKLGIDMNNRRRPSSRGSSSRYDSRSNGRFDYNGISSRRDRDRDHDDYRHMSRRARADHDFEEIVFQTSFDAREILRKMNGALDYYEIVTVSDFYRMAGIEPDPPDEKWGWSDLDGARIIRLRNNEGFTLDLPRPESMD